MPSIQHHRVGRRGAGASGPPHRHTFAELFDARRNSLNAIRIALALAVIVSHAFVIGGYGDEPGYLNSTVGTWAVAGFFAISGYLITASRFSSRGFGDFLWRRALRIYPGFWTALLVVAVVAAPLTAALLPDPSYSVASSAQYVIGNVTLLNRQPTIAATLAGVPFPFDWNGSLWTLKYEFGCYLMVGLLVTLMRTRARTVVALLVLFLGTSAVDLYFTVKHGGGQTNVPIRVIAQLVPFFAAGGLLHLWRARTPCSPVAATVSALLLIASVALGVFPVVAPLPMAYLVMWLGARLPLQRFHSVDDVSYGTYIYAFPVEQALVLLLGARTVPAPLYILLAAVITVSLAWVSWRLVERPAMRLKRLTAGRGPDREGHILPTAPSA